MVCPSSLAVLGMWAFPVPGSLSQGGEACKCDVTKVNTREKLWSQAKLCHCRLSLNLRVVSQNMMVRSLKDPRIHTQKNLGTQCGNSRIFTTF